MAWRKLQRSITVSNAKGHTGFILLIEALYLGEPQQLESVPIQIYGGAQVFSKIHLTSTHTTKQVGKMQTQMKESNPLPFLISGHFTSLFDSSLVVALLS